MKWIPWRDCGQPLVIDNMVLKCMYFCVTGQSICTTGGKLMITVANSVERKKIIYGPYNVRFCVYFEKVLLLWGNASDLSRK